MNADNITAAHAEIQQRYKGVEPTPPIKYIRLAEHHWLEIFDMDGHSFGLIVAQWCPGAKRWSRSGDVGTNIYLTTNHWKYVAHCPMPE